MKSHRYARHMVWPKSLAFDMFGHVMTVVCSCYSVGIFIVC